MASLDLDTPDAIHGLAMHMSVLILMPRHQY